MNEVLTRLIPASADGIGDAASLLREGRLVAFPTETVYGLGARADQGEAAARIFEAKGRPSFNPLIVHCVDQDMARGLARFDAAADRLAAAFWPGPLTLVLPVHDEAPIAPIVRAGLPTVALRCPAHPVARQLLRLAGLPIAAPSANRSGRLSPTLAAHVMQGLSGRIDAVLDGGAAAVGVESTIVATGPEPRLLRPGGLPKAEIEACLGLPLLDGTTPGERPDAPGQLASHYAPQATLRLDATAARPGEVLLGFGTIEGDNSLSPSGDLREAAANLFVQLHDLDRGPECRIAVAPIPEVGLGEAINDRLRRAAAARVASGVPGR